MRRALPLLLLAAACGDRAPAAPAAEAEPPASTSQTSAAEPSPTPAAAPAPSVGFEYTSLDGCELLERNTEEAGYSLERCPGVGGWTVKRSESDLRQSIALVNAAGRETQMDLPAAAGAGFSRLGPQAEWRVREKAAEPHALIVRYAVAEDPEAPSRETSRLVVIDLDGTRPCVTAVVPPGAGQNEAARRLADEERACR